MKKEYLIGLIILIVAAIAIFSLETNSKKTSTYSSMQMVSPTSVAGIIDQTQTAGKYKIELHIGPQEQMSTKADVASKHITTGEEMISGEMSTQGAMLPTSTNASGMSMFQGANPSPTSAAMQTNGNEAMNNPTVKHLEVHVYYAKAGTVVKDATIAIAVVNTKTNVKTTLPIAVMQGIGQSISDLHYGNNISLENGQAYLVNVTVNGQKTVFNITI